MKSYTDIEQSKKLAEILPLESADMYYSKHDTIYADTLYDSCDIHFFHIRGYTPCWSLAALLDVLPAGTETNKQTDGSILCYYVGVYNNKKYFSTKRYDNLIDACYWMILKLHELKML